MVSGKLGALTAALLLGAGAARADVSISSKPTSNMTCDSGVCTATAQKAVLNVGDLQTMLASGDVAVKTGTLAKDIEVAAPLTWSTTSRLTLDAQQSVIVKKQVTVAGQGAVTVTTNDGAKHGEFIIVPEHGSVEFWDTASSLIIDSASYTLVNDIKTLAADIAANASGFYALAKPYDASADGMYKSPPVPTEFLGTFDGLGNVITRITMSFPSLQNPIPGGLFEWVGPTGAIRHLGVENGDIEGSNDAGLGMLAGASYGVISRVWATGVINQTQVGGQAVGGLIGGNAGSIMNAYAKVKISVLSAGFSAGGGLAGVNQGLVKLSSADGTIVYRKANDVHLGGLVGRNSGLIEDTFAINSVRIARQTYESDCGGLVGLNENRGQILTSYAAGLVKNNTSGNDIGGLIGNDQTTGQIASAYWDLDKGISDPSRGAGNIKNDPGITGLTDAQLKSGLPAGFDPKIWNQDSHRNRGYPYLVSAPAK